jgi:hypothetical protein
MLIGKLSATKYTRPTNILPDAESTRIDVRGRNPMVVEER